MDYNYPCLTSAVFTFACFKAMNMLFAGILVNRIATAMICRQNVLKELDLAKLAPLSFHLTSAERSSEMVVLTKNGFIEILLMHSQVML